MEQDQPTGTRVGVISDTHGLLRPEAIAALTGSDLIFHAGDIGSAQVLQGLEAIAPVVSVRGNNDTEVWAQSVPAEQIIKVEDLVVCLLHDVKDLGSYAGASAFQVVISGHSHQPLIEERQGILFVNPGSAGRRRFRLPVAVARLDICGRAVKAAILELI